MAPSLSAIQGAVKDGSSLARNPSPGLRCSLTRRVSIPSGNNSPASVRQHVNVLPRGTPSRRPLAVRASSAADRAASSDVVDVVDTELIPSRSEDHSTAASSVAAFAEGDVRALSGFEAEPQGSSSSAAPYDSREAVGSTGNGLSRTDEAGSRDVEAGSREAETDSEATNLAKTGGNEKVESSGNSSSKNAGDSEGGDGEEEGESEEDGDEEVEPGYKMSRVCDRLIDVFWVEKPTPEDWRKLLAYSEEWARIRPHFFRRCESRAKELEAEDKPGKAAEVYRLARRLKEVPLF